MEGVSYSLILHTHTRDFRTDRWLLLRQERFDSISLGIHRILRAGDCNARLFFARKKAEPPFSSFITGAVLSCVFTEIIH